jgi:hypothetical protein
MDSRAVYFGFRPKPESVAGMSHTPTAIKVIWHDGDGFLRLQDGRLKLKTAEFCCFCIERF